MFRDYSRVQQRLLGLCGPLRSRPDADAQPPERLIFTPESLEVLYAQAYATGNVRGGPLFGSVLEGEVTVVAVATGGVQALDATLRYDPFRIDPAYLLGWSDSLAFRYGRQVDWVGNWAMRADGVLGSIDEDVRWLRRGADSDLFNGQHFLCCLGWQGPVLHARACLYDRIEIEPIWLEIDL